jgi:hypothetical protein
VSHPEKIFPRLALGLFLLLALCACAPTQAAVTVTFDMGGGTAGFAATIYAQEVTTGKTFHVFYPAGSHGLVVLPTSPPVTFSVDAPGTYVFYAVLINEDSYHFGATGCKAASNCPTSELLAFDVLPGRSYAVYIGDRSARIPPTAVPVAVPWRR